MSRSESVYELVDSTVENEFPFETDEETIRHLNDVLPKRYEFQIHYADDGTRVETWKYLGRVEVTEL